MTLQPRVPVYIVIGRIVAVLGLSLALAVAIFVLLAGDVALGLGALAAAVPFGALIFLIERAPGGAEGRTNDERRMTNDEADRSG